VVRECRRRSGRDNRQGARLAVSLRRAAGDAQGQAAPHR
jgi:hypothetical protein